MLYPQIEWRYRMTKMLKEAPYVRLYDKDSNLVAEINDREIILRLWKSMNLWDRKKTQPVPGNPMIGSLDYPTNLKWSESPEAEVFHFPIYIFSDGRAQWGITPDRHHWFWSKDLKDELSKLLVGYIVENNISTYTYTNRSKPFRFLMHRIMS